MITFLQLQQSTCGVYLLFQTITMHISVHINRMSFTDWCKLFTDADVCRIINTSLISVHKTWNEVVHFGSWTKNAEPLLNRCGGCANHKSTFLQNPQVLQPLRGLTSPVFMPTYTYNIYLFLFNFFYSTCLMLQRRSMRS